MVYLFIGLLVYWLILLLVSVLLSIYTRNQYPWAASGINVPSQVPCQPAYQ